MGMKMIRRSLNLMCPSRLSRGIGIRLAAILLVWAAFGDVTLAQRSDPSDLVFDDTSLPTVLITIDQVHLDDLFAPGNQYSDEERPAAFAFVRGSDTMRVDSVGFRFRGNTSRDSRKKSFKVSFNTFRRGQKFRGLEKLNLNGEHNDPSIMRSKVAWDLFRDMGVPASRANHVRLYVNDEYLGLYINVEHVDEQFLQRYFGNDAGNLYKCLWPADLAWLGSDADSYRPTGSDRRPYDLKLRDSDLEGYDDLARLVDVLHNAGPLEFPEAIESVFNVTGFLRALAVTTLTGSWDSYWFLKNNYYLYLDPASGLFQYIPFDFDNTMGIWWDGIYPGLDWSTRNVYDWGHPDPLEFRPLVDRVLAVPDFRDRYTLYLHLLLDGPFHPDTLNSRVLGLRSVIGDAAIEDTYRTLDYGYTTQDFYSSYTMALGGHVTQGLLPFITQRVNSAETQLDVVDARPVLSEFRVAPEVARIGTAITVSVRVEDEVSDPSVELRFTSGSQPYREVSMTRAAALGRDVYAATIAAPSQPTTISLYVTATDPADQVTKSTEVTVPVLQDIELVINEVMAANVSTIADSATEFDDWLELYNGSVEDLSLAGFTLSDDRGRPGKWTLPDTSIDAGGFLMVWADEDGVQGPMHANFRLSRLGEYLGLYDSAGVPLDSISFPSQVDDVSYGRTPDGADVWSVLASATPGSPNSGPVGVDEGPGGVAPTLRVFPNPFRTGLQASVDGETGGRFELYDVLGRRVSILVIEGPAPARFRWDGTLGRGFPSPAGVYVLRYTNDRGVSQSSTIVRLR